MICSNPLLSVCPCGPHPPILSGVLEPETHNKERTCNQAEVVVLLVPLSLSRRLPMPFRSGDAGYCLIRAPRRHGADSRLHVFITRPADF